MKHTLLPLLVLIQGSALGLFAQGSLVANGVIQNANTSAISVIKNPEKSYYTGFILRSQGGNGFRFSPVVDEGVRTFLVNFNDTISLQPIQSGSYIELLTPNTYPFAQGVPFYVGLYTGRNPNGSLSPPADGVYQNPLFGWARLENVGGKIQLLDSALVSNAAGIQAGTTTILQVPEPGPLGLAALGLLALGWHRQTARPGLRQPAREPNC